MNFNFYITLDGLNDISLDFDLDNFTNKNNNSKIPIRFFSNFIFSKSVKDTDN